jgi:hypothetical protein
VKRTAHLTDALLLELVTLTDRDTPEAAAAHLATCPRCASWSRTCVTTAPNRRPRS